MVSTSKKDNHGNFQKSTSWYSYFSLMLNQAHLFVINGHIDEYEHIDVHAHVVGSSM